MSNARTSGPLALRCSRACRGEGQAGGGLVHQPERQEDVDRARLCSRRGERSGGDDRPAVLSHAVLAGRRQPCTAADSRHHRWR